MHAGSRSMHAWQSSRLAEIVSGESLERRVEDVEELRRDHGGVREAVCEHEGEASLKGVVGEDGGPEEGAQDGLRLSVALGFAADREPDGVALEHLPELLVAHGGPVALSDAGGGFKGKGVQGEEGGGGGGGARERAETQWLV